MAKKLNSENPLVKHLIQENNIKIASALRSWFNNWEELSYFFNFQEEIRKLIYTTNIIESLHS